MSASLLLAVRVFAILRAQVLWRQAVGPLWWVIAAALAVLILPWTSVSLEGGAVLDPTSVVAELLLGTVLGIVASLPGWALHGSAQAMSTVLRVGTPALGGLLVALTLAFAMGMGLHHALLQAAVDTAQAWPLGQPAAWIERADAAVVARAGHALLVLALAFATPVLLVAAVVEVATGLVGRGPAGVTPPVQTTTAWLRAAAALVALGASWQAYGQVWAEAAVGG